MAETRSSASVTPAPVGNPLFDLLAHIGARPGEAAVRRRPAPNHNILEVCLVPGAVLRHRPDTFGRYRVEYGALTPASSF